MTTKNQPAAIDILEQAVNLLRANPRAWIVYLLGAVPFTLALLIFLNDMRFSPYAFDHLAPWSLALAALYIWKNTWQAIFAARLYKSLSPGDSPRLYIGRAFLVQCTLQPAGLAFPIPLPWLTAFLRNVAMFTAIGAPNAMRTARRQAVLWSNQTWAILSFITIALVLLFVNILVMVIAIPELARSFLGIEGDFARAGIRLLSWSTVSVAAGLAWMLIDPLLDAVFVLRCFYGESLATGEDLRSALSKLIVTVALFVLMIAAIVGAAPHAIAQSNAPTPAISPTQLDHSIEQVIQSREFTWRNPRASSGDESKWVGWVRGVLNMIDRFISAVIKTISDWLNPHQPQEADQPGSPVTPRALKAAVGILIAVIAGAAIAFFLRRRAPVTKAVAVTTAASINLADESVTADQLPESQWLQLADELLTHGDFRLALRALHLAGLNYLGERNLVSIRKWKTGLEYRREVERRARAKSQVAPAVAPVFSSNVDLFERGWYGRYPVDREMIDLFTARLSEIRNHAR